MEYAPIILFVYNRPEHTRKTINALKDNQLAFCSDLFIFADGPKSNITEVELDKIKQTRDICKAVEGFNSVTVIESTDNKGLSKNIINGVTEIVNKYGKVIVLEDDIVTGKYFLNFMNDSLEKYQEKKNVYAISGWYYPIDDDSNEAFLLSSFNCWGWGTWKDRWETFKKDCSFYKKAFTKQMIYKFNIDGRYDYWSQILDNEKGIRNTWFIFWYAGAFLNNGLCLFPSKSLVNNSGCDGTGENCALEYFQQKLDIDVMIKSFPDSIEEDLVRKKKLIDYLDKLNKQYLLRGVIKNILRKINLYGFVRSIYKKIR